VGLSVFKLVSFGPGDRPPQDGRNTGEKNDNLENVLDKLIEISKDATHKGQGESRDYPLSIEGDGAQGQHHETPEDHDMEDADPEVARLSPLEDAVDDEIGKPLP